MLSFRRTPAARPALAAVALATLAAVAQSPHTGVPQLDPHARVQGAESAAHDSNGPSAGTSTCASCHASQARTQPLTPMGRALEIPASNSTLKDHPDLNFHRGDYTYRVQTAGGKSTYTVSDGQQTISLPVKWSMGVGGQTWVLEQKGKLYESLVSFYPAISGLDITTGDEIVKPATLQEAMGRELSSEDSKACFGCHASNAVVDGNLNLATLKPGISCEHCHEGALLHANDAEQGSFDTAPPKLKDLSSEHISDFCGKCHRTWEVVVRNHWRGPVNARFPAYRIANSRCFNGADPRISCIACHDPHQDVAREKTAYDSKCLACHAPALSVEVSPASGAKLVGASLERPKVCPVAKSECVSCHMPKVVFPGGGGHLTFTDHDIRVVKAGESYPN